MDPTRRIRRRHLEGETESLPLSPARRTTTSGVAHEELLKEHDNSTWKTVRRQVVAFFAANSRKLRETLCRGCTDSSDEENTACRLVACHRDPSVPGKGFVGIRRPAVLLLLTFGVVAGFLLVAYCSDGHRDPSALDQLSVVIPSRLAFVKTTARSKTPFKFPNGSLDSDKTADYGSLKIEFVNTSAHGSLSRRIRSDDNQQYEQWRLVMLNETDDRMAYMYWHEDEMVDLRFSCRRPRWAKLSYPVCNAMHEIDLSRDFSPEEAKHLGDSDNEFDNYYVSSGFYRDVWVNSRPPDPTKTIIKTTQMHFDFDYKNLYGVQREALVMERLTSFSQIVDIYAFCGTSVIVEAVPYEVEKYVIPGSGYKKEEAGYQYGDMLSENSFSPEEKLETALQMAESIAVLHGYEGGMIIHDDIQLQQWLRAADGKLKLGDFNRATIPEWNDMDHEYCKFSNGAAFGNYRSPEEYAAADLDEQIDVYSFGNNIYGLLTGLWVFYTSQDDFVVQKRILSGEKPSVNERLRFSENYIERKLVEVMEKCWAKRSQRVDIFTAVNLLRAIKDTP